MTVSSWSALIILEVSLVVLGVAQKHILVDMEKVAKLNRKTTFANEKSKCLSECLHARCLYTQVTKMLNL